MDLYKKVQEIKEIKRIDHLEQYNFVKRKKPTKRETCYPGGRGGFKN